MEAHFLNILSNYGDVGIVIMFLLWEAKQMKKLHGEVKNEMEGRHKETVDLLQEMTKTNNKIEKQLAVFGLKLDHGDDRFIKVEEDIKLLKDTQTEIRQRLHDIRDDMMSKEMYTMIKEIEKGKVTNP